MDNSYQHSTIAQILENILNEFVFEGESRSDIADILLSILNKTEYNKETDSVIADLLVRLKAKIEGSSFDPYDGDSTSRIADIIISILEETEYNEEPQSRIAELLLELKAELSNYGEVDLGTLNYQYNTDGFFYTVNLRNLVKRAETNDDIIALRCNLYTATSRNDLVDNLPNYSMAINTAGTLQIVNKDYSTSSEFKTAMSGVILYYPLATPSREMSLSKSPINEELEDLKDLDELQDLDISDKEVK